MSARVSVDGSAAACSGAMYAGVPSAMPIDVSAVPAVASVIAFATPKSVMTADFPVSSTLSGLMSRWAIPFPCAYSSARATSRRMVMTSPIARESRAQRFPLDERHRVIREPVHLADREERHDVRVLKPRGDADLTLEPRDRHGARELFRQQLRDDTPPEHEVLGDEHA